MAQIWIITIMEKRKSLCDYLKSINMMMFDELYSHPATCLAVFRELSELSGHFVMRLLLIDQAVPKAVITAWIDKNKMEAGELACQELSVLRIWHSIDMGAARTGWRLNRRFQENLRIVTLGGVSTLQENAPLEPDRHAKDKTFLEDYATERWECILHYIIGSQCQGEVNIMIQDVLERSELIKKNDGGSDHVITQKGFHFLLLDRSTQIWDFVLNYLDVLQEKTNSLVEALQFLFQLSSSTYGKNYPATNLTATQTIMLQNLREFGLVYQRKRNSQRFYPTRLAIGVASGQRTSTTDASHLSTKVSEGYLVVETNYRLYAYTDSPLKVALLDLFSQLLYRYPNLVVANITRESVRAALTKGISAHQIISFLESNAHPEMLKQSPILPPTLVDQLRLWDLEKDRFVFEEGCLYEEFLSVSDFQVLRDYAKDINVLLWENPEKRRMVVTKLGHEEVRKFWKRHKP